MEIAEGKLNFANKNTFFDLFSMATHHGSEAVLHSET